ncbi:unnamed protein product [Meganyctiphanes norvegica]|uniref:Uncharacterized protein n=1 Tax=Meganyctiphanes norvegica TaxID=48144 RepID=A0AAV2S6Z8_MEGNR
MCDDYLIKWGYHQQTIIEALVTFKNSETFCDAQIICNGGVFNVHKLILSACSDYLHQIFENATASFPGISLTVIVLQEVSYKQMEYLLEFIYKGQVDICENDIDAFMNTARYLDIKGLSAPDGYEDSIHDDNVKVKDEPDEDQGLEKSNFSISFGTDEPDEENLSLKKETPKRVKQHEKNMNKSPLGNVDFFNTFCSIDTKRDMLIKKVMEEASSTWIKLFKSSVEGVACPFCHKEFTNKTNFKIHYKSHKKIPYICPRCPYLSESRHSLNLHLHQCTWRPIDTIKDEQTRLTNSMPDDNINKQVLKLNSKGLFYLGEKGDSKTSTTKTFQNVSEKQKMDCIKMELEYVSDNKIPRTTPRSKNYRVVKRKVKLEHVSDGTTKDLRKKVRAIKESTKMESIYPN